MINSMAGKTAVVTGGGSGIGRSACTIFAQRGARVAVVDVDVQMGERTVEMIRQMGGDAVFLKVDVSISSQVEVMVEQTVKEFGSLDYAFNNAGIELGAFLLQHMPKKAGID